MCLHEKGACQNDMKTVSFTTFMVFASWTGTERFVLLNGPVPECLRLVNRKETAGSQRLELTVANVGNHRLPLQGTAGSHRLEVMVPNLGTMRLPLQATAGSQRLETHASQPGNHRFTIAKKLPIPKGWN